MSTRTHLWWHLLNIVQYQCYLNWLNSFYFVVSDKVWNHQTNEDTLFKVCKLSYYKIGNALNGESSERGFGNPPHVHMYVFRRNVTFTVRPFGEVMSHIHCQCCWNTVARSRQMRPMNPPGDPRSYHRGSVWRSMGSLGFAENVSEWKWTDDSTYVLISNFHCALAKCGPAWSILTPFFIGCMVSADYWLADYPELRRTTQPSTIGGPLGEPGFCIFCSAVHSFQTAYMWLQLGVNARYSNICGVCKDCMGMASLPQDCSDPIANALKLPQPSTKPSIWHRITRISEWYKYTCIKFKLIHKLWLTRSLLLPPSQQWLAYPRTRRGYVI